jgi:uncharacterized protein YjbI with pentapeptide repeats
VIHPLPSLTIADRAALENLEKAPIDDPRKAFAALARSVGRNLETDFRGADLRGFLLQGQDLRAIVLEGADFRGADLRGAELRPEDEHCVLREGALTGQATYEPPDPLSVWIARWKVLQVLGNEEIITEEAQELLIACYAVAPVPEEEISLIQSWIAPVRTKMEADEAASPEITESEEASVWSSYDANELRQRVNSSTDDFRVAFNELRRQDSAQNRQRLREAASTIMRTAARVTIVLDRIEAALAKKR